MKKSIVISLILALFTVTAVMAQHHGPKAPGECCANGRMCDGQGFGNRGHGAGMILKMADKLNLSEDQISEIKATMEKNELARIDQKAELEKAQLKLRHLKMNNAADSDILAAMDQVGKLKTEMQKMRFRHRSKIESILTDDQKAQLKDLQKECMQRPEVPGVPRPGCRMGMNDKAGRGPAGMNFDRPFQSDDWGE